MRQLVHEHAPRRFVVARTVGSVGTDAQENALAFVLVQAQEVGVLVRQQLCQRPDLVAMRTTHMQHGRVACEPFQVPQDEPVKSVVRGGIRVHHALPKHAAGRGHRSRPRLGSAQEAGVQLAGRIAPRPRRLLLVERVDFVVLGPDDGHQRAIS